VLVQLHDLSEGRAKVEEFTTQDRLSLLDLFVNSETVLVKMHQLLFPNTTLGFKQLSQLHTGSDKVLDSTRRSIHDSISMLPIINTPLTRSARK
jgi:hypothetical protein